MTTNNQQDRVICRKLNKVNKMIETTKVFYLPIDAQQRVSTRHVTYYAFPNLVSFWTVNHTHTNTGKSN